MTSVIAMRKVHKKAIDQNPITITINRRTRSDANGGHLITPSTVGPYTVRIFFKSILGGADELSTLGGSEIRDNNWGMFTDHLSEVKATIDIEDSFTVEGMGEFKVKQVYPWMILGQVVGYQAWLEKVS